jgi:hypothetical protein
MRAVAVRAGLGSGHTLAVEAEETTPILVQGLIRLNDS